MEAAFWTGPDALFIVYDTEDLIDPQLLALTNDEQLLSQAGERNSKVILRSTFSLRLLSLRY